MKQLLTFCLFCYFLNAAPAFGQTQKIVANFDAFFFNNIVQLNDSSTFSYNNHLQLNERISWKVDGAGAWSLKSKFTDYAYDPSDKILTYISQSRKGNGWVNSLRYTYTYNAGGK